MKFGKAYAIFANIDSPDYTDEEKGAAILQILKMETHNSVTKAAMLKVINYLIRLSFEMPEDQESGHV